MLTHVAKLSDGKCFGDVALNTDKPRNATIFAHEDTHLAVLVRPDYE